MKIEIICNEKGTGKTKYALKKYTPYKYFTKDKNNFIEQISDSQSFYCIFDSVDSIPEPVFNDIINNIVLLEWKSIIFIFDIVKEQLMNCPNFNIMWECGIIPRNYKFENFIESKTNFNNFFLKYYPELSESEYDNVLKMTNYNFNQIDRLMLLNNLHSDSVEKIDIKAIAKYINEIIKNKFKDIPDADILLQKASIIGEQFVCDALESPIGFGYETASDIVNQMEEMHGFIRSCIDANLKYEFISRDIYNGIFNNITNENKICWIKILINYYKIQYERCTDIINQLSILNQLNNLYELLPTHIAERKSVCFQLLYRYRKANQTYNALEISKELIKDLAIILNPTELAFIQNYQIKTLMQLGQYKQALEILQNVINTEKYSGSKMRIKYYYAYCLFLTGNVDMSYTITKELVDYLKYTSGSNTHSQELFCMTYSLMATLQNHLNLDDNGIKYYNLALSNAESTLKDKSYFFDILRKCDMFYKYKNTKTKLEKCIDFYEQTGNLYSAGEVYVNLATEMMFQGYVEKNEIKNYFEKAILYFFSNHNEKLVYAKNNYGIYLIVVENDIETALKYFKESLIAGLSDFTYMTIYLNICMCYLLLGNTENDEFNDVYYHFKFAKKKLNKRQYATKYENMYETILDILIREYKGENVVQKCDNILNSLDIDEFFVPLLNDIKKRNCHENNSFYKDNSFFYMKMNQLHCFFAEFRFWE